MVTELRVDTKEDMNAYFAIWEESDATMGRFLKLPWVLALFEKRDQDNRLRVPCEGRSVVVTQAQYILTRKLWRKPRLLGYDLIAGDH